MYIVLVLYTCTCVIRILTKLFNRKGQYLYKGQDRTFILVPKCPFSEVLLYIHVHTKHSWFSYHCCTFCRVDINHQSVCKAKPDNERNKTISFIQRHEILE